MRARWSVVVLALLAGAQLVVAVNAVADPPWQSGTVFAAATGQRFGGDGGAYAIAPGGSVSQLGFGSAQDVAVASDGTVYWVTCSGDVDEYVPGSGESFVRSVTNCPTAVAVTPGGDLLIDNFSNLQQCPATSGGSCTTVSDAIAGASGLAEDADGDIYAMSGGGNLLVLPAGASVPVAVQGFFGGAGTANSLRFGPGAALVTAVPFASTVQVEAPDSLTATTYDFGGDYLGGAVLDSGGNVFASDGKDSPSTHDQIDEIASGTSTPTVLATNFDTPRGLATYPAVTVASRAASSVALGASPPSPVTVSDPVTLTATVDGGVTGLGGLVQFAAGGRPLGDAVPVTDGVATETTTLPAGDDSLTATYLGDALRDPAQSAATDYTVSRLVTTTSLTTTSSSTPPQDQPVHVVAIVHTAHTGVATGTVDFRIGSRTVTSQSLDSHGRAAADITLPAGTSAVKAYYSGDQTYSPSTSRKLSFTTASPFTPDLQASVQYGPTRPDGSEAMAIVVKVLAAKGQPAPTGRVTADTGFSCSALDVQTYESVSRCRAVVPSGFYVVTVNYSGDAVYDPGQTDVDFGIGG